MKRLFKSFKYAFHGIRYNFRTQQNFKIHILCSFLAIALALFLKFSLTEWAILSIVICLVFAAEVFNTAIEESVNCATKEMTEEARDSKDSAAAGVLIMAFLSLLVAAFLYLPKIMVLVGIGV